MSTAEVLAILAVAISALSVIATLILGIRRFDHERELDDRQDARSTLADGALELGRMKAVMKDTLTQFDAPLRGGADWPTDFKDYIRKMELANEAVESALAAVRIRFPEGNAVVVELDGAHKAVRSLITVYTLAYGPRDHDPDMDWHEAWRFSEVFDKHKEAYLAAAQTAVGAKLT